MRPITILLISIAVFIAGGLAFFSKRLVEGQVQRAVKSAETAETVQVLVAAKIIGTGKVLDATDIRYDMWPKAVATGQNVIVRKDKTDPLKDHVGMVARRDLFVGEPIGASSVYKSDAGSKLSVLLDPGMRAITFNITPESAIAGLAVPGDRVDIILTADMSKAGGDNRPATPTDFVRYVSETVLANVKLIAIDQTVSRESSSKDKDAAKAVAGGVVGRTATVAVKPEDAEKLILAGQMGKLSLILRSVADSPDDRAGKYTTDIETSAVLGRLIGKARGGPSDGETKQPRPAPSETGGSGPVIINRGGDRLAR